MGILKDAPNIDDSWLIGQSTTLAHRTLFRKHFPSLVLLTLTLIPIILLIQPQTAKSQTLNQAVANQLDLQCARFD